MESSSSFKLGAAFAAGVVVALGSALIYVKSSGFHPQSVVEAAPAAQRQTSQPETIPTGPEDGSQPLQIPAKPADPVIPPSPTPTPAASITEPASPPPAPRKEIEHSTPVPKAKHNYPHRSALPMTQSAIRVQISQMTPTPLPPPPPDDLAVQSSPVPSQQPAVRTVSEDQAQLPEGPQIGQQPQYPNPEPAPVQPHVITLQEGTNLVVRLGETLSTDHNFTGDTFRGSLDAPIVVDGFIIADKGSKVLGRIVAADKAGRLEGNASLQLELTEINTTDGQRVRIESGLYSRRGPSNSPEEAVKIAGGAALGAIIGAIAGGGKGAAIGAGAGGAAGTGAVLLGHGKPSVIPSETRMSFQMARPVTITEKLN